MESKQEKQAHKLTRSEIIIILEHLKGAVKDLSNMIDELEFPNQLLKSEGASLSMGVEEIKSKLAEILPN